MKLEDRRVIADKVLAYLKEQKIKSCVDSSSTLEGVSVALGEPKWNIWKAFDLLRMMGRIELNNPNGRKGFRVLDYSPLSNGVPDRPPPEKLRCPLVDKAVKEERAATIEYIQEAFGKTEVGKQILKAFEPIHLEPLPKMPWEKENGGVKH